MRINGKQQRRLGGPLGLLTRRFGSVAILAVLFSGEVSNRSYADVATTTWTVVDYLSFVRISGTVYYGASPLAVLTEQRPRNLPDLGSLESHLTGTVVTTQTLGGPTTDGSLSPARSPIDITVQSAMLDVVSSGSYDPLPGGNMGQAPGDFGGVMDAGVFGGALAAFRDITLGISSDPQPLSSIAYNQEITSGTTPITINVLSATVDWRPYGAIANIIGSPQPSLDMSGLTSTGIWQPWIFYTSGLTGTAGLRLLTGGFDFEVAFYDGGTATPTDDIRLVGHMDLLVELRAPASTVVLSVPEAGSFGLSCLLAGAATFGLAIRRRWLRQKNGEL